MTQTDPQDVIPESMRSADRVQPRPVLWAITLTGVALSLFQLYTAGIEPLGLFYQRTAHLGFILFLAFLLFPLTGQSRPRTWWAWVIDAGFLVASFLSGFYIIWYLDDIIARAGWWTTADIVVGIVCIVAVLEASRRAVGFGLTLIGIIAILYALAGSRGALPWLGDMMPGILAHRGASVDRLVGQLYLGQEGIFGLPLGVAATFVFMFVLFGAFLEKTGAGKFFIDLAFAATGRKPGGPAKAAVIASAGMGSISGSAIANVVTTGAFTIPLMKKLGYRPAQAGGVEAAASTGGQITPPLMGAGAFLISEYTRIPYIDIVLVSIFPAILYLGTVYLFVHIVAMKQGMRGLDAAELPVVKQVLAAGWQFIVPLILLVVLLVNNISPMRVGFWAIISVIAMAGLRGAWALYADGPMTGARIRESVMRGIRMIFESLELGARNAVAVSIACAVAGIIVGVVGLTGLGLKFSSMMVSLSGGNIVIALALVLVASLILGLGLPVTASYIVLIVLVGPALNTEFGIPLLIAHLVVFWYSQDSNVTPPVALAGFAGAAIAGAKPMETSVQAWKFAKGLYLIPAFMVFNPELIMGGPVPYVIWTGFSAALGLIAFAATIEGYLFAPMKAWMRLALVPPIIGLFWPSFAAELAGAAAILVLLGLNWMAGRQDRTVLAPETARTRPD
ncbi:TRAP transporter permease [Roseibaca sp. Y0-43]|uniref:TRAP transporter permease n=1 Tax=Roseibaca sp. Y0-43 TaxID=2816854 RepID=UPI001D0C43B6|nr:TRAP transporter fused permease subunit [Roseibaca sp. Y0-43]MCC1482598.1 TRAP transporter fused permease subunit [Roseibaca sp. Y0-43]